MYIDWKFWLHNVPLEIIKSSYLWLRSLLGVYLFMGDTVTLTPEKYS